MIAILDYICLGFKANIRKDAGVVERGGLEIRYTALLYPGFESLSFRKEGPEVQAFGPSCEERRDENPDGFVIV